MLLTSSQVSFAVSAGIVVLCTFALFLSGYVIQQRTLRQLRESIREPRPEPPKVFLPDRFKKMTTELEDGSVITLDDDEEGEEEEEENEAADTPSRSQASPAVGGPADVEIVVKMSTPGDEDGTRAQQQQQRLTGADGADESSEPDAPAEAKAPTEKTTSSENPEQPEKPAKPVSRAERRRLIKEELIRLSHYEKPVYYQRRLY